jgi:hypothetical protein
MGIPGEKLAWCLYGRVKSNPFGFRLNILSLTRNYLNKTLVEMKKFLLVPFVFAAMLFWNTVSAQEVGLRFGDVLGNSVAIDGVFGLGQFSRIHADVSFGDRGVGIEALWNPLYRPLGDEAFHWYVGVGPSLLLGDPFILGVSGEIGLEYKFNAVPIVLGLDWRPRVDIVEVTDFNPGGFGLNIRYAFGSN